MSLNEKTVRFSRTRVCPKCSGPSDNLGVCTECLDRLGDYYAQFEEDWDVQAEDEGVNREIVKEMFRRGVTLQDISEAMNIHYDTANWIIIHAKKNGLTRTKKSKKHKDYPDATVLLRSLEDTAGTSECERMQQQRSPGRNKPRMQRSPARRTRASKSS